MKVLIFVTWLTTMGAAFWVGLISTGNKSQDAKLAAASHKEGFGSELSNLSHSVKSSKEVKSSDRNSTGLSSKFFINNIVDNLLAFREGEKGGLGYSWALYEQVKDLTDEELLEVLKGLKNSGFDGAETPFLKILALYTEKDPGKAMESYENFFEGFPKDKRPGVLHLNYPVYDILTAWVSKDPTAALDWYKEKYEGKIKANNRSYKDYRMYSEMSKIFNHMANKDLETALTEMKTLTQDNSIPLGAVEGIAMTLNSKEDFAYFLASLKGAANEGESGAEILKKWSKKNIEEAKEYVESLSDEKTKSELVNGLVQEMIRSSTISKKESADWCLAQATGEQKQKTANLIVDRWASGFGGGAEDALGWIESNKNSINTEQAMLALFNSAMFNQTWFVGQNLHRISNVQLQKELSEKVYRFLSYDEARKFAESSPFKEDLDKINKSKTSRRSGGMSWFGK